MPMANIRGDRMEPSGLEVLSGLIRLVQILSFLVVFVAGIIIGLGTAAHFGEYYTKPAKIVFSNVAWSPPSHTEEDNFSVLRPRKKVDCLSMKRFINPTNDSLRHDLTDEELLWRASLWPDKKKYPFLRVPKVAFMFLTRGPLPLMPLWEKFFLGHEKYYSIYVHAPQRYVLNVSTDSPFYGRTIPSKDVSWGSVSLVDAEKRLLANALLDFSNERFVLLSESCIPVYDFVTVYKYLINSKHAFVESYDQPSRWARGRYNSRMHPEIRLYHWRKGSQWFEMQRELAVHVVGEVKYYNLFKRYCKPACYPDEHYIPTYFNMFYGELNSNRTVTWVDWSFVGPHPATYSAENITEDFIQSIRSNATECWYNSESTSVCYLFARKFDPSTLVPLLNISSTVMGY